jgi:hypothetical protein
MAIWSATYAQALSGCVRLLRNDDFGSTGDASDLRQWLYGAGLSDVSIDRDDGLSVFSALRP